MVRYAASVATCTLNSDGLAQELARAAPDGLAIVGTMRTENLGIERLVRNMLANPNIRFLVLCGEDTRHLIGHLPGQSMESLFANGIDEKQRIVGAKGKRPFLKNVAHEQIEAFKEQVRLVSMIGERDATRIARAIVERHAQRLSAFAPAVMDFIIETVQAKEPQFYKSTLRVSSWSIPTVGLPRWWSSITRTPACLTAWCKVRRLQPSMRKS